MKVGKEELRIYANGERLEQVKTFKYLGTEVTEDWKSIREIKARIGMAKGAFKKKDCSEIKWIWN